MSEPVLVMSPSMNQRRQPLLKAEKSSLPKKRTKGKGCKGHDHHNENRRGGKKFGEVAGGTAAECAAVCCCCPFTVMNLLVLAVYKVPAGLCKKAWRKQRKRQRIARRKQVGGLLMGPTSKGWEGTQLQKQELLVEGKTHEKADDNDDDDDDNDDDDDDGVSDELEKEMWDQFHVTGFWRSPSQIEPQTHT